MRPPRQLRGRAAGLAAGLALVVAAAAAAQAIIGPGFELERAGRLDQAADLYLALSQPDSARSAARQWARARPRDPGPYREWALALEEAGANAAARDVLLAGRQALGDAMALAVELAEG